MNSNLPDPNFLNKSNWADPIGGNKEHGIFFKVMEPSSNYCGMIFKIKDTDLKAYVSEEDGNTYIDYTYETDESPGSKIYIHGANRFEKELNQFLLKAIQEEDRRANAGTN